MSMYCGVCALQELEGDSAGSADQLTTLACWQLVRFVLRRNARIVPRSSVPRLSHVDIPVMECKEKKNAFHVCMAVRWKQQRMMVMNWRANCVIWSKTQMTCAWFVTPKTCLVLHAFRLVILLTRLTIKFLYLAGLWARVSLSLLRPGLNKEMVWTTN